jgi:hypothetical protein
MVVKNHQAEKISTSHAKITQQIFYLRRIGDMDLMSEIAQIKRINQDLLDLLDRMVRKQVEHENKMRQFERKLQLSERAGREKTEAAQLANDSRLWVRVYDICRSKRNPNSLLPISAGSWYRGVQEGRFPKPHKLGRSSLWRLEDIKRLVSPSDQWDDQ